MMMKWPDYDITDDIIPDDTNDLVIHTGISDIDWWWLILLLLLVVPDIIIWAVVTHYYCYPDLMLQYYWFNLLTWFRPTVFIAIDHLMVLLIIDDVIAGIGYCRDLKHLLIVMIHYW